MSNWFRRFLIEIGMFTPFLFAFIVSVGYIEDAHSIIDNRIVAYSNGAVMYGCPLSIWVSDWLYIDFYDVMMVWILCFALELCKYSVRCALYLTLNLPIRWAMQTVALDDAIIVLVCTLMAVTGLFCALNGIRKRMWNKWSCRRRYNM